MKRPTANDNLEFMCGPIPLALHDLTGKDDVFEVEDGEAVVLEFVDCMDGDEVMAGTD